MNFKNNRIMKIEIKFFKDSKNQKKIEFMTNLYL